MSRMVVEFFVRHNSTVLPGLLFSYEEPPNSQNCKTTFIAAVMPLTTTLIFSNSKTLLAKLAWNASLNDL